MVEGRHTGQPCTSGLTLENSMVSLRRQGSNYLGEQAVVMVMSLGLKFGVYGAELSHVVNLWKVERQPWST